MSLSSVPDEIRRELTVSAPRERVWRSITEPAQLVRWFCTERAEVDLRPGGAMRFAWRVDFDDEAVVDEIDPERRLTFRWRPAGSARPYTIVTFALADADGGGTTITLTERGFASLPDQIGRQSYEGNDQGWANELDELRAYIEETG